MEDNPKPTMRLEDMQEVPAFGIRQGWHVNLEDELGKYFLLTVDPSNVMILGITWTEPDTVVLILEDGSEHRVPHDLLIPVWVFSAWSYANADAELPA